MRLNPSSDLGAHLPIEESRNFFIIISHILVNKHFNNQIWYNKVLSQRCSYSSETMSTINHLWKAVFMAMPLSARIVLWLLYFVQSINPVPFNDFLLSPSFPKMKWRNLLCPLLSPAMRLEILRERRKWCSDWTGKGVSYIPGVSDFCHTQDTWKLWLQPTLRWSIITGRICSTMCWPSCQL